MECVANYEIKSDVSVTEDNRWLKFKHPKGLFRARIRNIPRKDYSTPFLLSLHLTFDAPSLVDAKPIADERLADCLNMIALATGSALRRHRIRQIVDCTPGGTMRSIHMWGDAIRHENPQPFIDEQITRSIEHLLEFDQPPAIRRALRWYRIGIHAESPDDQFQYFWFALELVAIAQKSSVQVPDKCPHCKSPLYCETCKTHPVHKPYEKQAIRDLMRAVDKASEEKTLDMLESTRNALMHGGTLKELQKKLPEPHEDIVDALGRIVFKALVHQFPRDIFKGGEIVMGTPSTYVHRTLSGIAHIETVVPMDADGELDLNFPGTTMEMTADAPPQSARPALIGMTNEQFKRLEQLRYRKGDHQEMCRRIYERSRKQPGDLIASVILSTDLVQILEAVKRGDTGEWQDFFREVIGDGKPNGPKR